MTQTTATPINNSGLKFFYNGIKGSDKKLQKAWYSDEELCNAPKGTITIYAREIQRFSAEVRNAFTVINDTDIMTDYFESDRIRVTPNHPLFAEVKAALELMKVHREAKTIKKMSTRFNK